MSKKIKALALVGIITIQFSAPITKVFADELHSTKANKQQMKVRNIEESKSKGTVVKIPDNNLKAILNEQLGQREDSNITKEQLRGLTNDLNLADAQIKNLDGLQYCTNIKELDLSQNEISNISELSNLKNLKELDLSWNKISNISALSNLTNLKSLDLVYNEISDIKALSNLTNLEKLSLFENKISDIKALSNLTNLKILQLSGNKISDIRGLSNLTKLEMLELFGNNISDIRELSNLTNLYFLHLDQNNISDIRGLSNLTNLRELSLFENEISDIRGLSNLTKLETLYLNQNKISDIRGLLNLKNLYFLHLGENKISDISKLPKLKNLQLLNLDKNQISDISPLNQLTELQIFSALSQNIQLNKLTASSGNNIKIKNNIKDKNGKIIPLTISSKSGRYNSSSKAIELNKIKSNSTVKCKFYKKISTDKQEGEFSGIVSQPISIVKVSTPYAKAASKSYNSNKIYWEKVSGASGYTVDRATTKNGKYKHIKTVTSGKTTSYTNSKLTTGKTYYYKVRAYKIVNKKRVYSSCSKVISARPTLSTTSINLSTSRKKATIKWKKVSGANGYEIYRATSKRGKYKKIKIARSSVTSYTNSKLTTKKMYYYKVRSYKIVNKNKIYSSYSHTEKIKIK